MSALRLQLIAMVVLSIPVLTFSAPSDGNQQAADWQKDFLPKANIGRLLVDRLDITTFRSSLGPRRTPAMRHFADLGLKPTLIRDDTIEFDAEDWFYGLTVLERGDKNGDGLEDLVVRIDDHAKQGTYATTMELVVTRFSKSGDLVAIAFQP